MAHITNKGEHLLRDSGWVSRGNRGTREKAEEPVWQGRVDRRWWSVVPRRRPLRDHLVPWHPLLFQVCASSTLTNGR